MTSKIKVDNITDQDDNNIINESGDVITVGAAGDTVAVAGNIVKSNALQASDGGNIVNQSGTTITLGASGDTITLASGASQTGFGRTGTVDWQTGSIKTATFTAANGEGYFADTSSGSFTMNLPAATAGNIVSVADYTNTFQTNALTVTPNGSQKLGGVAAPANLSTEGQSVTLVYVDDTEGWKNVQDSTSNTTGNPNLVASGGTETTCGNFKIHTFTGPGTFTVSNISTTAAENTVGYLVLAGGGGGGHIVGGGAGAGGFREGRNAPIDNFTASPLVANAPTNAVTVTATSFPITVGGGGAGNSNGSNSVFSTITSAGGANGGTNGTGGSGGSGGGSGNKGGSGGAGNTPPVSPSQGNPGGAAQPGVGEGSGAGGGGAGGTGPSQPGVEPTPGAPGGNGASTSITGSSVTRAGGGGGGGRSAPGAPGGPGGGGAGSAPGVSATSAGANTGSGGGGTGYPNPAPAGGSGGSGIVVIRYKFQ